MRPCFSAPPGENASERPQALTEVTTRCAADAPGTSCCCWVGKQEKNMGEINLPASAPNTSSNSLELGRNISSVQAAPSMFFMGCLGPLLQHLVGERHLGSVELRPAPLWQLLGSSMI